MVFVNYNYGADKDKIKKLLRYRLKLKDRIRYHISKIKMHEDKVKGIEKFELVECEKELDSLLNKRK